MQLIKKITALTLALCLVVSMIPAFSLSAGALDEVAPLASLIEDFDVRLISTIGELKTIEGSKIYDTYLGETLIDLCPPASLSDTLSSKWLPWIEITYKQSWGEATENLISKVEVFKGDAALDIGGNDRVTNKEYAGKWLHVNAVTTKDNLGATAEATYTIKVTMETATIVQTVSQTIDVVANGENWTVQGTAGQNLFTGSVPGATYKTAPAAEITVVETLTLYLFNKI